MRSGLLLLFVSAAVLVGCHGGGSPATDAGVDAGAGAVDAGAHFAELTYRATMTLGYAQETTIAIVGGATDSFVFLDVKDVAPELAAGFIGPGCIDEILELKAGQRVDVRFTVTGVNALQSSYQVPMLLSTVDSPTADPTTGKVIGHATLGVTLIEPRLNVTTTLVSTNPTTLAQHWQVTNNGDDLPNLDVVPQGAFATLVTLTPAVEHVELVHGDTLEFDVVPVLYPGMTRIDGKLAVSAGTQTTLVPVAITAPAGKEVFVGFGASVHAFNDRGGHCTNEGPLKGKLGKGARDPSGLDVVVAFSKEAIGNLYEAWAVGSVGAAKTFNQITGMTMLNAPLTAANMVFKGIAGRIKKDPPDANFTVIARPTFRTPPTVTADPTIELTAEGAAAWNALMANTYLLVGLGEAASATIDKLGGARAANDADWADRQETVLRGYGQMLVARAQTQADLLRAFINVAPSAMSQSLSADQVQAMQADLATNGFTAAEKQAAFAMGLTQADLDAMQVELLAASPDAIAQVSWDEMATYTHCGDVLSVPDLARLFELTAMTRASSRVTSARMLVRFELPAGRCAITPHTTILRFNGHEVQRFTNNVPEGLFDLAVDPAQVQFFGPLPLGNELGVEAVDLSNGNYVRVLDETLLVELPIHGELVLAGTQAEADALVGSLSTTNHSSPDLVLSTDPAPFLDRATVTASTTVNLAVTVRNAGQGASTATQLGVYGLDPRLGDPGSPLTTTLPVPVLAPGQTVKLTVPLPGTLLLDQLDFVHALWVPQPNDYLPDTNVVTISNEGTCQP